MQCNDCGAVHADSHTFCTTCGQILSNENGLAFLGRFQLVGEVGRGGMGVVYLGTDPVTHQDAAIKVLHRSIITDVKQVKRFHREAKVQASLVHPNITQVIDLYEDEFTLALIMEFLHGCTLRHYGYRRNRLPISEIIYIAKHIIFGLAAAHQQGIIHRDLKASNIFITDDGDIKLMDFGLAKSNCKSHDITSVDETVGSYLYMAPEQILGEGNDARTDLYSTGILLYKLCTGEYPFNATDSGNSFEIMEKQVRQDPQPPQSINASIPDAMSEVILKLLQKSPDKRPESCEQVLALLDQVGSPSPPTLPEGVDCFSKLGSEKEESVQEATQDIATSLLDFDKSPVLNFIFKKRKKAEETHAIEVEKAEEKAAAIPEKCLLYSFRSANAAPQEPPIDLRTPPPIPPHILAKLKQAIHEIPPLPEIWHQIQSLFEDSTASPLDLARIIEQDSILTAHILRCVNTAAYQSRGAKEITDISLGITRIGMNMAKNLVLQFLVPEMGGMAEGSSKSRRSIWYHNQAISLIAGVLSESSMSVDSKIASLYGMLHDIGKLVILHVESEETLKQLETSIAGGIPSLKAEWSLMQYTHIDAGMMLALHWKLPKKVHRFIYYHHHPNWYTPDCWPTDVQAAIMLEHTAHLILQHLDLQVPNKSMHSPWDASKRTRVDQSESLLRNPLRLPVTDAALYGHIQHEIDNLKLLFPDIFPIES
ncbi:MAG: HDOD domain-containing protein [Mariprofundaceae bacterium]